MILQEFERPFHRIVEDMSVFFLSIQWCFLFTPITVAEKIGQNLAASGDECAFFLSFFCDFW